VGFDGRSVHITATKFLSVDGTFRSEWALMPLPLELRRATLAAHIVCAVGWLGAAAAYLALGVAAGTSREVQIIRHAWIGMELTGWFVIGPLACLAFLTGLVLSLGTHGGCFGTTGS
jgi:hypothetical protein